MKKLAIWAKAHLVAARWAVAGGRVALGFIGFSAGVFATARGLVGGTDLFAVSALLFLFALLAYPHPNGPSRSFRWRKCCDAGLVASSCVFWLAVGNLVPQFAASGNLVGTSTALLKGEQLVSRASVEPIATKSPTGFFKKTRSWKTLRSLAGEFVETVREADRTLHWGLFALLVIATLAIVIAIGYVTAAVSCSLSCNGQEGAAVLVAFLGTTLAILLPILIWRGVIRRAKRKKAAAK